MKTPESSRMTRLVGGSLSLTPVQKAVQHIAGNLCRDEAGQWVSCGEAGMSAVKGENLVMTGPKGGTLPGGVFEDKEVGTKYVVKFYPNPAQGCVESVSNMLYGAAGFRAPSSALVTDVKHEGKSKTGVAGEFIPGISGISQSTLTSSTVWARSVASGYGMDALLANWDVIGTDWDNVGILSNRVVRIDNGGSMMFRAQGGSKNYPSDRVDELDSLLDPSRNPRTAAVYNLAFESDPTLKLKSLQTASKLPDDAIEMACRVAGFDKAGWSKEQVDNLIGTIKGRRDFIGKEVARMEGKPVAEEEKPRSTERSEEARQMERTLARMRPKADKLMNEFIARGGVPTEVSQFNSDQREMAMKHIATKLLKDPAAYIPVECIDGFKGDYAGRMLVEKIIGDWSGSPHERAAQWYRQVACEFYGRDPKQEYLQQGPKWLKTIPEPIREVAMAIKSASEAIFVKHFEIKDWNREKKVIWRGVQGAYGHKIWEIASKRRGGTIEVGVNSLESFSYVDHIASNFSTQQSVVFREEVKRFEVWGFGGFGTSSEREILVGRRRPVISYRRKTDILLKAICIELLMKESPEFIQMLRDKELIVLEPVETPSPVVAPGSPIFDISADDLNYVWLRHVHVA